MRETINYGFFSHCFFYDIISKCVLSIDYEYVDLIEIKTYFNI